MNRLRAAALLGALAASPLLAQFGTTHKESGLKLQVRYLGEKWSPPATNGLDVQKAGTVGSGRALDGLSIDHPLIAVRSQVATSDGWLAWAEPGVQTGVSGSAIVGVKLKAEGRAIRYRGSFVGAGVKQWVSDGEELAAGGAPLEAFEVEIQDAATKDAVGFEYRVFFAGSGFTPWLKSGQPAEGKGEKPFATALQVRGPGLKTEVSFQRGGWQPTALDGEVAGDTRGVRAIEAIRIFSDGAPVQYRLKVEGSGWRPWNSSGEDATTGGRNLRVEGIVLDLKHAPAP